MEQQNVKSENEKFRPFICENLNANKFSLKWLWKLITAPNENVRFHMINIMCSSNELNYKEYSKVLSLEPDNPNDVYVRDCKIRLFTGDYYW